MFDMEAWRAKQRAAVARYAATRARIAELETHSARELAVVRDTYEWPAGEPVADDPTGFRTEQIGARHYAEDLVGEVAIATRCSLGAAWHLVADTVTLTDQLPACWARVAGGEAPLWQARSVVRACDGLAPHQCAVVDQTVAPALGGIVGGRLARLVKAAVMLADPDGTRRLAKLSKQRFVQINPDKHDPLTGTVWAKLDIAQAMNLKQTVYQMGRRLPVTSDDPDDTPDADARRAQALGLLADPTAASALLDGSPVEPRGPRAQVYVHMCANTLADASAIARIETLGPVLMSQVAEVTRAAKVRLTPVVHIGARSIAADNYEIPTTIREHVLARDTHDCFPWSTIESRYLDLDHVTPYDFENGTTGQTSTNNLAPLSRRAHRLKTHISGWDYSQPEPGLYLWHTPTGQRAQVDQHGTHYLPRRE
jgi:hypothetical protein